jgi:hypothetical protein
MTPLLWLAACAGTKDTAVNCDTLAAVSVSVTLVDDAGAPLPASAEPTVSYTSDAGMSGSCDNIGDTWLCGYEVAGPMTIRADAWGYGAITEAVTIEADTCHVIGQALTLALSPVDCTSEEVPGIVVTVRDALGDDLAGAEVGYCPVDAECDQPFVCEAYGSAFACAPEMAGTFGVDVAAPGFVAQYHEVTVAEDECHVITEHLDAVLDPA